MSDRENPCNRFSFSNSICFFKIVWIVQMWLLSSKKSLHFKWLKNDFCWKIILSQDTTRSHWTCFVDEAFVLELSQTDSLERTFLIFLLFDTNSKRFKGEGEEVGKDRRGLRKLLREGESDGFKRISHAYTHTLFHTHSLFPSLSLTHTYTLSPSLSPSNTFFLLLYVFQTHTHTLFLSPSLSFTHTQTLFLYPSLSLIHILSHLSHSLSHTHALSLISSYCIVYFVCSPLSSDEKMNNLFLAKCLLLKSLGHMSLHSFLHLKMRLIPRCLIHIL